MFVVIYDPYGNLYQAKCVSKDHKTKREAIKAMRSLFEADCVKKKCDEYEKEEYLSESGNDYIFTPRGYEDACYKVIRV